MKDQIIERIQDLKSERNAVVIAHNYIRPEVQNVSDFVGDSLALAVKANEMDCEVIVFCGPNFMVETVAILNPDKTVLYANADARCPMASMCEVDDIKLLKEQHPDVPVAGYLNTTAHSKTEMDICYTSSNAVDVIRSLDTDRVIFVPDRNLGMYVQRSLPDIEIILWPGYCTVHERFIKRERVVELIEAHPDAEVLVHPECTPEVIDLADVVLSTDGMVERVKTSPSQEFIVGTERELIHRMERECPGKTYHPVPTMPCGTMRRISIEDVLNVLETMGTKVSLDEEVVVGARRPLERMLALNKREQVEGTSIHLDSTTHPMAKYVGNRLQRVSRDHLRKKVEKHA
jgi:quinolinate synthase